MTERQKIRKEAFEEVAKLIEDKIGTFETGEDPRYDYNTRETMNMTAEHLADEVRDLAAQEEPAKVGSAVAEAPPARPRGVQIYCQNDEDIL